jgi:SAM-dependent methyltransferase
MKKIFIDENINILTGFEAQKALEKENDKIFLSPDNGILKISEERWVKAQNTEKKHWLTRAITALDDRNEYHYRQFEYYNILRKKEFKSALEIGCGPFTNARFISRVCKLNEVSLLDPLISEYLHHPFVAYNRKYLYLHNSGLLIKGVAKFTPSLFEPFLKVFYKKVRIGEIFNFPVEKLQANKKYDLIIIINVIEHCFDVPEAFNKILKLSHKGTILIFEDKLYDHEKVIKEVENSYDAAHPLKVDRKFISDFLDSNFKTLYKRNQPNSLDLVEGAEMFWDDLYYIGEKY